LPSFTAYFKIATKPRIRLEMVMALVYQVLLPSLTKYLMAARITR
jgi:hypothetical protein